MEIILLNKVVKMTRMVILDKKVNIKVIEPNIIEIIIIMIDLDLN